MHVRQRSGGRVKKSSGSPGNRKKYAPTHSEVAKRFNSTKESLCCLHLRIRSYQLNCTASHQNCEVKRAWANLVLRWGTTWEQFGAVSDYTFCFASILQGRRVSPSCMRASERANMHAGRRARVVTNTASDLRSSFAPPSHRIVTGTARRERERERGEWIEG